MDPKKGYLIFGTATLLLLLITIIAYATFEPTSPVLKRSSSSSTSSDVVMNVTAISLSNSISPLEQVSVLKEKTSMAYVKKKPYPRESEGSIERIWDRTLGVNAARVLMVAFVVMGIGLMCYFVTITRPTPPPKPSRLLAFRSFISTVIRIFHISTLVKTIILIIWGSFSLAKAYFKDHLIFSIVCIVMVFQVFSYLWLILSHITYLLLLPYTGISYLLSFVLPSSFVNGISICCIAYLLVLCVYIDVTYFPIFSRAIFTFFNVYSMVYRWDSSQHRDSVFNERVAILIAAFIDAEVMLTVPTQPGQQNPGWGIIGYV